MLRTVQVPVRVEQLVVERELLDPTEGVAASTPAGDRAGRDVEIVLHEEVPVVSVDVRPVEVVRVTVRTVQGRDVVEADLRSEQVVVEGAAGPGPAGEPLGG